MLNMKIFLFFLDLVGIDLLRAVEQSRIEGKVINSMDSTFLTLIPKCEKPLTFADFQPISLCNLIYKLISKIAAICLKPILDKAIYVQQYGFSRIYLLLNLLVLPRNFFALSKPKTSRLWYSS